MKKTILITGASGDIGSEICRFFIKNNYKVIGTYNKNKATIEALAEELGSDFSYYQCDLSDFNNADLSMTFLPLMPTWGRFKIDWHGCPIAKGSIKLLFPKKSKASKPLPTRLHSKLRKAKAVLQH